MPAKKHQRVANGLDLIAQRKARQEALGASVVFALDGMVPKPPELCAADISVGRQLYQFMTGSTDLIGTEKATLRLYADIGQLARLLTA